MKVKQCRRVETVDLNKSSNGFLVDILNRNDSIFASRRDEKFEQIYYSTVFRGRFKGLHIHPSKVDTIHCVFGSALFVIYPHIVEKENLGEPILLNDLIVVPFNDVSDCLTISFPSKYPHGYYGVSDIAYILNYRNPAWNPQDTLQYDLKVDGIENYLEARIAEQ